MGKVARNAWDQTRPEPGVNTFRRFDVRKAIIILIGVAVALRLLWAILVPVEPVSDAAAYDAFARTLVEHGEFGFVKEQPLGFWPPGTSLIYAATYSVFGIHPAAAVAVNVLMMVILLVVSARLALRLYGATTAVYSVVLLAVWPTLIMYSTIIASEVPYLLFTIAALDAWTSDVHSSWLKGAASGGLLGLAALVRPSAIALPFIFAVCELVRRGVSRDQGWRQGKCLAAAVVAMCLVIAPWTWRNYQLFGEVVLVSTNGPVTLWMGNHHGTNSSFSELPPDVVELPEVERARVLGDAAWEYIAEDPMGFIARGAKKLVLLYGNESVGAGWNAGIQSRYGENAQFILKRLTQLSWAAIFGVALVGLWAQVRDAGLVRTAMSPVVAMVLFHSAIHAVVVAQERYHLSFATQIAILFAIGVQTLMGAMHQRVHELQESG